MKTDNEGLVGIDSAVSQAITRKLVAAFGAIGYETRILQAPFSWLANHSTNTLVVAIPKRMPLRIEATRASAAGSIIIGACDYSPSASIYREYVNAGVASIIGPDLPANDLPRVLTTTINGLVVLPPHVATAISSRLDEAPGDLHLSARDKQLLNLIAQGTSPAAIALEVGCSERHLRRLTAELLDRIGANSRTHAAALAARWGLAAASDHACAE